jgi:hypothetical protein
MSIIVLTIWFCVHGVCTPTESNDAWPSMEACKARQSLLLAQISPNDLANIAITCEWRLGI